MSQWPQHQRNGSWITDENGATMLAWHVSGGVFNLGFNNHDVAQLVADTVMAHDAGYWSAPSEIRDLGEHGYNRILPDGLDRTFFTVSASEAFEVACKLAKRRTGRHGLVSMTGGYYGAVGFALSMDDPLLKPETYGPLAGPYSKAEFGSIDDLDRLVDETTAAVCLETIQVPAGVLEAPEGYLREVRRLCDERGAMLVIDEVSSGLFRTGDAWAFESHGMVPDLLVAGKGVGGGYYPIGALSMAEESLAVFDERPPLHRSSFLGSEIAAQVASGVAAMYLEPGFGDRVLRLGERLRSGLDEIHRRFPDVITEVRGRGLLYAFDTASGRAATAIAHQAKQHGLYLNRAVRWQCLPVMSTLVTNDAEVDDGLARLTAAVEAVADPEAVNQEEMPR